MEQIQDLEKVSNNFTTNDTCSETPLQSGCSSVWLGDYFTFYLVHCTALAQIAVSIVSCIIVIFCIVIARYRESGERGFSERFPLYIAINDLIWGICHAVDHTLLLSTQLYPSKIVVIIISSVNYYAFAYQQLMFAAVSVYTYFVIVKETSLNLGRWEWKLTLGCVIFVALCTIALQRVGALGISRYWLFGAEGDQWIYQTLLSAILTTVQALSTIFAYASIKRTVLKNKSRVEGSTKEDKDTGGVGRLNSSTSIIQNGYHQTAARCLSTFVAIGIFLYLPLTLMLWASVAVTVAGIDLLKIDHNICLVFTFLFFPFVNCGGFVNGVGYFRNSGIKRERRK